MTGRHTAQTRIDFGQERPQMQLPGKQSAGEIAHYPGLNVPRLDAAISNGLLPRLDNHVAQRSPFLFEIALKIRAPDSQDIDWLRHNPIVGANKPLGNPRVREVPQQRYGLPTRVRLLAGHLRLCHSGSASTD